MTDERNLYVVISANGAGYRAAMQDAGRETEQFGAKAQAAGGKVDAAGRSMDDAGRASDQFGSKARSAGRDVEQMGQQVDRSRGNVAAFRKETDNARQGVSTLIAAAVGLGPALIPITAAAIPTVMGLTAGLGALAGAGGVAFLALKGVGTAVQAVNAYQASPTAANLAKLRQELEDFGPAGAQFVSYLNAIQPRIESLQQAARAGLFPGLEQSIHDLMPHLEGVKGFVTTMSSELGSLTARGTKDMATDPQWEKFFKYVNSDGVITLDAFAKATGNVTKGVAGLMTAMSGSTLGFDDRITREAQKFADWSAGLDHNQGFQKFMDYVRTEGPQVSSTLHSVGSALLQVAESAAPMGGVTLTVLKDVSDILGAIADSPIGPQLFELSAALVLFQKLPGGKDMLAGLKSLGPALKAAGAEGMAAWNGTAAAADQATAAVVEGEKAQQAAIAGTAAMVREKNAALGSVGVGAPAAADTVGQAVQMSKLQSLLAFQNSPVLNGVRGGARAVGGGLASAAAYPWAFLSNGGWGGVAEQWAARPASSGMFSRIGGAVSASASGLASRVGPGLTAAAGPVGMMMLADGMSRGSGGIGDLEQVGGGAFLGGAMTGSPWGAAAGATIAVGMQFVSTMGLAKSAVRDLNTALQSTSFTNLTQGLQTANDDASKYLAATGMGTSGLGALAHFVAHPGSTAAGISDYWFNGSKGMQAQYNAQTKANESDSISYLLSSTMMGRTGQTTPDAALAKYLPAMNAHGQDLSFWVNKLTADATANGGGGASAMKADLAALNHELAAYNRATDSAEGHTENVNKVLKEMSTGALTAADSASALGTALDSMMSPAVQADQALNNWIKAYKAIGKLQGSAGFRGTTDAAVNNRDVTDAYVSSVTARLTAMAGNGSSVKDIAAALKDSRDQFIQEGKAAGFSAQQMSARADALGLTKKLVDTVTKTAQTTGKSLDDLGKKKVQPTVTVDSATANAEIASIKANLASLAMIKVNGSMSVTGVTANVPPAVTGNSLLSMWGLPTGGSSSGGGSSNPLFPFINKAAGGYISGPGTGTSDSIHAKVSNGEFVINAAATARHRGLLEAINGHHFANGGYVGYDSKRYATPVAHPHTVVVQSGAQMPAVLTLQVDGHQFTAYVRGHAGQVAQQVVDSNGQGLVTSGRQNWR